MSTSKRHWILVTLAAAVTSLAAGVPTAGADPWWNDEQASVTRPDDRTGMRVADLVSGTASASTSGSTPQGLKADGLRLQGIAQVYERMQGRPAASFYTPQALKAEGLRWQAIGQAYAGHRTAMVSASSSRSGFNWRDAGIGAAFALGLVAVGGGALLVGRRRWDSTATT